MTVYELITNTTTLSLGGLCVVLLLSYDFWKKLYFWRHGIPGPFPLPLLGNIQNLTKGFTSDMIAKHEKYGNVYGMTVMNPIFIIRDLDILKEILISRFPSFPNHTGDPIEEEPFSKGVNVSRDGHWKAVRSALSPAFTGNKMKHMTPIINKCCDQLVEHFDEKRKTETGVQCKDLFGAYSMDVVASTFFGLEVDSQKNPDDPFVKYAKTAFQLGLTNVKLLLVLIIPGLDKLYKWLGIKVMDQNMTNFFKGVVSQAIEMRKKEGTSARKDMLQLLIDAHKLDSDEEGEKDELVNGDINGETSSQALTKTPLTDEEIMANSVLFIVAGYETTTAALCMTAYLIATHKEEQEKLIQEIDEFAPRKEDIIYENLSKMEYLDCFVRESLRIYPPLAMTDRMNDKEDFVVKGITIPKGFAVFIPIYAIHHDPEVWNEPEEFRPERFSKENRSKISPVSWLPFGDGPRICLGMRLALMEIKFALIRMLQEFQFETCSETEIPPVLNKKTAFICPANGVKLQFVPRKKTD